MKKRISFLLIIFILIQMQISVYATDVVKMNVDEQAEVSLLNLKDLEELLTGGEGVKIQNVKITGYNLQIGKFSGASYVDGFENIDDGIVLTTGDVRQNMFVPAYTFLSTNFQEFQYGHPKEKGVFDEIAIEFDAISDSNFISFQYIFASEEFDQAYTFDDKMKIEVNGKNIALNPSTGQEISYVNLVNTKYHYDNKNGEKLAYLGYTPLLSCQADVKPGQVNHFKILVQDIGDPIYDTAIFIKAHSITNKPAPEPEENPNPPTGDIPQPKMNFSKEISAVKLVLSNGTILNDVVIQNDKVTGLAGGIAYSDNLIITIDEEIIHGATLIVEYKFIAENTGTVACSEYKIDDLKDNKFIFKGNQKLLTEDTTNQEQGWKMTNSDTIEYSSTDPIKIGEKVEKKIVLSKVVSSSALDDDEFAYQNSAKVQFVCDRSSVAKESKAKDVVLLPPFGKPNFTPYYILGIYMNVIVIVIVGCVKLYKKVVH